MDLNIGSSRPQPAAEPVAGAAAAPETDARPVVTGAVQAGATATPPPTPPSAPPPWAYTPPHTPSGEPPRQRMSGCLIAILVAIGLVVVCGAIAMLVIAVAGNPKASSTFSVPGDRIGVISISGVIQTGSEDSSWLSAGTAGSRAIMEQLRAAGKDRGIKAVVLRINSPGGSAAASQEIYEEVLRLRDESKKKVIVSMADVAASGGYYISAAATKIVASPATMTGSIGVITESVNWAGFAGKYGVKGETITSGPYKDTMNPFRAMRDDERKLMQAMINEVYDQFVRDVATGRKMDEKTIRKLADGRVYSGSQARRVKLVDELGNFHDAVKLAAKEAGIRGEPKLKEFGRSSGLYGVLNEMTRMRSGAGLGLPLGEGPLGSGPGLWMLMQSGQQVVAR